MPLHCPHCQIVQAEENKTCINCGKSLTPARAVSALPDADPNLLAETKQASWRLPALIAVGLLLALVASAFLIARRGPAVRAYSVAPAQAQMPDAAPTVPVDVSSPPISPVSPEAGAKTAARTTPLTTTPLTITLVSKSEGQHVKVGDEVTFTAFTSLVRGQSATLTLSYRRAGGKKTMHSFAQGSLWSTTWTPFTPGRYEFTATALGDHQQGAISHSLEITVDKPAPQIMAQATPPVAPPHRAVRLLPPRRASSRRAPSRRVKARTAAAAKPPAPALTYHVAAAQFSFSRSAVVLANALSHRGYLAVPERMADSHGKTVYVVVTGSYRHPKEAHDAALALQRSGYPAYFYGSR